MKTKKNFLKKLTAGILGFVMTLGVGAAGYAGAAGETRAADVTYKFTPNASTSGNTATSYVTSAYSFTHNNIEWSFNQWNPSNLQIKTNQSSAGSEFNFKNTSAFPGAIKSVVITFSALTVSDASKLCFVGGTSAISSLSGGSAGTWNSTAKTLTWSPDSTTNYTYFAFYQNGKAASGTNKLATSDAIVVTYSGGSIAVTGVALNKTSTTIAKGSSETLTATISPADATNKNVTWTVENDNPSGCVTVNDGVVSANSAGTATVKVTTQDGGKTATCSVTVVEPTVTSVSVNHGSISGTEKNNATMQCTATVSGTNNPPNTVTWKLTNTNNYNDTSSVTVASINESGLITFADNGTVYAWATSTYDDDKYGSSSCTASGLVDAIYYSKVTDANNLVDGAQVLIVNESANKALGGQNSNNRAAVDVTISSSKIKYDSSKTYSVLTLGKVISDGKIYWTFYDSANSGYLYSASSSSNYLKVQTNSNANSEFSISITSGTCVPTSHGSNSRNLLKYNTSSALFSSYASSTSGVAAVSIYQYVDTSPIILDTPEFDDVFENNLLTWESVDNAVSYEIYFDDETTTNTVSADEELKFNTTNYEFEKSGNSHTAYIKAIAEADTRYRDSALSEGYDFTVEVFEPVATSVSLVCDEPASEYNEDGELDKTMNDTAVQLVATVLDQNGDPMPNEDQKITWNSTRNLTVSVTDGLISFLKRGAATITAAYTDDPTIVSEGFKVRVHEYYTVSFNRNGGTGSMGSIQNVEEVTEIPENGFTAPSGKVFDGWLIGSASGPKLTIGYKLLEDTTLFACWSNPYNFIKVTGSSDDNTDFTGQYIFVYEVDGAARVFNGADAASGYKAAVISNSKIAYDSNFAVIDVRKYDTGYSLQIISGTNSGKFISGTSNSNTINFKDTDDDKNASISLASGLASIVSNTSTFIYNKQSGNDRFRFYKSGTSGNNYSLPALYKKEVVVSFDPGEASTSATGMPNSQSFIQGGSATEPSPNPKWIGHKFVGWYNGSSEFDFTSPVTSNITLTAHWESLLSVTYSSGDAGNNAQGMPTSPVLLDVGETLTKPSDPTWTNHDFVGWYNGDNAWNFSDGVTSSMTLTAHWDAQLQVAFTSGAAGNNAQGMPTSPVYVSRGNAISAPANNPTWSKHIFDGWYNGDNLWNFSNKVNSDMTLTAHWLDTYSVTYNGNGATSGSVVDENVYTSKFTVKSNENGFAWADHAFVTWKDASGNEYEVGKEYSITNDLTLYAQWRSTVTYNVSFNNKGHGSTPQTQIVEDGSYATNPGDLSAVGYQFGGWYQSEDCTGTTFDFANTPITSSITLYAKWTPNQFNINYFDKGGTAFSGSHNSGYPVSHTYGATTELDEPTKTGYIFAGWYTTSDCSGSSISQLDGESYTEGPINLYAKWVFDASALNEVSTSFGMSFKYSKDSTPIVSEGAAQTKADSRDATNSSNYVYSFAQTGSSSIGLSGKTSEQFMNYVVDESESGIITGMETDCTNAYIGGNGGSGDAAWNIWNCLKVGKSKAGGSITLTLDSSKQFSSIIVYVIGNRDDGTITMNGTTKNVTKQAQKSDLTPMALEFDIEGGTSELTISSKNDTTYNSSICITAIEFVPNSVELDHIAIEGTPITSYTVGQAYSTSGLHIEAYYDDDSHETVSGTITINKSTAAMGDTSITYSATYEGKPATRDVNVTVNHSYSDVQFKLTIKTDGMDQLLAEYGDAFEDIGICVQYNGKTRYFSFVQADDDKYYMYEGKTQTAYKLTNGSFGLNIGDAINERDRASIEFTITVYVKDENGYHYSEVSNTTSLLSWFEEHNVPAYQTDQFKELYSIFYPSAN